jgi:hypothetical protein
MHIFSRFLVVTWRILFPSLVLTLAMYGCTTVTVNCDGDGGGGAGGCNRMGWNSGSAQTFIGLNGNAGAGQTSPVPAGYTCNATGSYKCKNSPGTCLGQNCKSYYNYPTGECWCGCP